MTPREIVLEQIRHHETEPVPYTLAFDPVVGTRLDEHFGSNAWRQRIVPYIANCGAVCALWHAPPDPEHRLDKFGTLWRADHTPPTVLKPGLAQPSFEGYDFPSVQDLLNTDAVANAAARAKATMDSFTIVNTGLCLWQSWYVRGFEETMMDCVAEEDFYAELLDRLTDLTIGLIEACKDIPANAIMMGDDWGVQRGIMLGPERWRKFYKPLYARIFDAIHAQGKIAIMHCCGSAAEIMGDIVDIGLDVLESVQPEAAGMDPYGLKKAWGDKITFWGCLGSQSVVPFGTPDQIRGEVQRLRREMGKGGGYILAPAKPMLTETPTENAIALVEEFLG
jgi:uroporphyrinogen decarboxylase